MMTLGPSGAGKTKCISILMKALTDCGEPITRIMDCVMILFMKRLDPPQIDPAGRACLKPSWSESLKLMSSSGFLPGLLNFPKDSINEETVEFMHPFLSVEDCNLESAKKVCDDVAGLCSDPGDVYILLDKQRSVTA